MSHTQYDSADPDFPSSSEEVTHLFECDADGCAAQHEGEGEFTEVWADAKSEGWRCRKVGGEWEHYCPKCARFR